MTVLILGVVLDPESFILIQDFPFATTRSSTDWESEGKAGLILYTHKKQAMNSIALEPTCVPHLTEKLSVQLLRTCYVPSLVYRLCVSIV